MRKLLNKFVLGVLVIASSLSADIVLNDPSGEIFLNISRSSVNRVVFPSKILARQYSKEKGLVVQAFGNEAFLKYAPLVEATSTKVGQMPDVHAPSSKIVYSKAKTAEVFFVTENKTYSITFKPKRMGPQTIRINENLAHKKKVVQYETRDPYKKTLKTIAYDVFNDITPRGYNLEVVSERFKNENLEVIKEKIYTGTLYKAYKYTIFNHGVKAISLDERNFIPLAEETPLFISTFYKRQLENLAPLDKAKLVIVTRGEGQ